MKFKYVFVDTDEYGFQLVIFWMKTPALLHKTDGLAKVLVNSDEFVDCFDMGANDL